MALMTDDPEDRSEQRKRLFMQQVGAGDQPLTNEPVEGKRHVCGSTLIVQTAPFEAIYCLECQLPVKPDELEDYVDTSSR